ncbi:hypothetical protein C1N83_20510 [Priestia aryabhattai]
MTRFMIVIGTGKTNSGKMMIKTDNTLLKHLLMTTSVMTLMMFLTIVLLPEIWHLSKNYMIAIGIYWDRGNTLLV